MAKFNLLLDFFKVISTANEIKKFPETRAKSARLGVASIIFSIISVPLAAGAAFLLSLLVNGNGDAALLLIFVIAGVLVCAGAMLITLLAALLRVIAQLTVNRRPISWIALALFIICLGACVAMFILFC